MNSEIIRISALPKSYFSQSELLGIMNMIEQDISTFGKGPIVFTEDYFGILFVDEKLKQRNLKRLEN